MPLELPNGWVSLPAPANLGLIARWEGVKDARLPPSYRAFSSTESHAFTQRVVSYVPDQDDEWQTPDETLRRGQGDCEDMAIFERALLLNGLGEGFAHKLWLVIVRDLILDKDHAILWTPIRYIDNRAPKPLLHSQFRDYRPIAAFNGTEAVAFGKRRAV